ncbi:hypothetical protein ACR77J_07985 [Tissierella praeacuta]|uniref:hypothetical protein n=1 Tax=Tissierella praeacuta TaxID=43131 RepID=UPI003DA48C89
MINKDELIKGTLNFIKKYERLPFMNGDDIEVEKLNDDNEIELRPYRGKKYVDELFGGQDKFTKYLLDNNILTLEIVSQYTKVKPDRIIELMSGKAEDIEASERRAIDIFFNKDYYEKKLGKYNGVNDKCRKECQFPYWVKVDHCGKHSKKENKNKK